MQDTIADLNLFGSLYSKTRDQFSAFIAEFCYVVEGDDFRVYDFSIVDKSSTHLRVDFAGKQFLVSFDFDHPSRTGIIGLYSRSCPSMLKEPEWKLRRDHRISSTGEVEEVGTTSDAPELLLRWIAGEACIS